MKNERKTLKVMMIYQFDDGEYGAMCGDYLNDDEPKVFNIENLTDILILTNGYFKGDLDVNEL